MIYALHLDDGTLVGVTNQEPVALPSVSIVELSVAPDLNNSTWDIESLSFIKSTTQMTKREFLARFTLTERAAIRASTDTIVQDLMFLLDAATYIDLTDTTLAQGIGYLSMVNLIEPSRVPEILGVN